MIGRSSDLGLGSVGDDWLEGVADACGFGGADVTEHLVVPVRSPPSATEPRYNISPTSREVPLYMCMQLMIHNVSDLK